jgi:hypothetical protein
VKASPYPELLTKIRPMQELDQETIRKLNTELSSEKLCIVPQLFCSAVFIQQGYHLTYTML